MKNFSEENEQRIRIIHNGKFYFSVFEGRHPSWCDVKVLQCTSKALVILSQPHHYIGTSIVNAIELIAAHIVNLFGLDPATTTYLQYIQPEIPQWFDEAYDNDPLMQIARQGLGPSDERYERIHIKWVPSDAKEPMLKRYSIHELPYWQPMAPSETAKLLEALSTP